MILEEGNMDTEPEYTVIKKNDLLELIEEVNCMMRKGWLPLGGISNKESGDHDHYYQAMIRDLTGEPPKGQ